LDLDAGREIAAKAEDKSLTTLLSERVAALESDMRHLTLCATVERASYGVWLPTYAH
jgi:hypothetical protein